MTSPRWPMVRPLYSAAEIAGRVEELADAVAATQPKDLLVVIVLKGGFVFGADLVRALARRDVRLEIDFVSLASYGTRLESSGQVRIVRDIEGPVTGRDVLLVDDVFDTGLTLQFARDLMAARGARRTAIAVLVNKAVPQKVGIEADYVGFTCPDYFVVGYGMDAAHAWRELPYVGVLQSAPADDGEEHP
jgi:hypoxanthine phosphoribosyltransferase